MKKLRIFLSMPLAIALVAAMLCGCSSVTSKKPVGDKPAALNPKDWNGKWRDGNGSILETRIKDAGLGIVELRPIKPPAKPGEPKSEDIMVRTLGPCLVASIAGEKTPDDYDFGRVVIDNTHIVAFAPDASVFLTLIKHHKIAGTYKPDKPANNTPANTIVEPSFSCKVEGFTDGDYERLQKEGFDMRSLFDEDPTVVWVRY